MTPPMHRPIETYDKTSFTGPLHAAGEAGAELTRPVYVRGPSIERDGAHGPTPPQPIIVIQELPGIMPETLRLCDMLNGAGFTVVLPHLFGPLGKMSIVGNTLRVLCMRREFTLFAKNQSSPVVNWLRALAQSTKADLGATGVGAIGMCLTGNFAISLMANGADGADGAVRAGVAAQPSLPLGGKDALHMSDAEVALVRARLDEIGPMHAYRFAGDTLCPGAKFKALDAAFNDDGQTRVELHTLPGNKHSVFTGHFVDEAGHPTRKAFDQVVGYFRARLSN